MAAMVDSSTPVSAPFHPAWAAPMIAEDRADQTPRAARRRVRSGLEVGVVLARLLHERVTVCHKENALRLRGTQKQINQSHG